MKTLKFSLMLRTRENTDVFISLDDNIYGIHSKRINILYIFIYRKLLKPFCQKPLDRFQYNLAEMFLLYPFTKIVQAVMICEKTWLLWGQGLFSLYIYIENFKNLLVRNHWTDFNVTWQECCFCDLPRLFTPS